MIRETREGKLFFDGVDMTELAKKHGTPLYVYSENDIIYLIVDFYRINEGIYIRLDDVYYPVVMPEILDSLNTKK